MSNIFLTILNRRKDAMNATGEHASSITLTKAERDELAAVCESSKLFWPQRGWAMTVGDGHEYIFGMRIEVKGVSDIESAVKQYNANLPVRNKATNKTGQAHSLHRPGSAKPRREDLAWQLETALTELSHGNLLNVMVHSQRAAAMALELCESRRGSPNDPSLATALKQ